jgi:hypothetical protein
VLATLLEILGFLLVVAAAYMVSLPLALLVAGAGLIVGAQVVSPRRRAKT